MHIYSGEAWHTYTTTLDLGCGLENLIHPLLESKLFSFCITNEGLLYHLEDGIIKNHRAILDFSPSFYGMHVNIPEFINNHADVAQTRALNIILHLILANHKAFNEPTKFPGKFLKFCVPTSFIKFEGQQDYDISTICLTLYESNVAQVTLINHHNLDDLDLETAIETNANRGNKPIESFLCCMAFIEKTIELNLFSSSKKEQIRNRKYYNKKIAEINEQPVEINLETSRFSCFEYIEEDSPLLLLSSIALTLVDIAGNEIDKSCKSKFERLLKPQRNGIFHKHGWHGHPSLFIAEHENQKDTASENLAHNKQFIRCLAIKAFVPEEDSLPDSAIPPDLRPFDDYNHLHSSAISITILSNKAKKNLESSPSGFINVITDCQAKTDSTLVMKQKIHEYGDQIRSAKTSLELDSLVIARDLAEEAFLMSARRSGEVYDFFKEAKADADYTAITEAIEKRLSINEKTKQRKEQADSQKKSLIITVFFGIIASGTLANDLMPPLLKKLGMELDTSEPGTKLAILIATYAILLALTAAIYKLPSSFKKSK